MKQEVLQLFNSYPQYALLLSIGVNILIAVLGVIPSVFLTAANILFFGFWQGTAISFAGESIGAVVAFILYRYGFKNKVQKGIERYPANHYLVVLSGYGNGVTGGMLTDDSSGGAMTTPELRKALDMVRENQSRFLAQTPEGKIDILGMDSCLMAMVEVASD